MEKRAEDLPRGENLTFEKNPFEIKKVILNRPENKKIEDVEDYLKISPPSEFRPLQPSQNFPKSNLLHLTFAPPSSERIQVIQHPSLEISKTIKYERSNVDVEKEESHFSERDFNDRDFIKLEKWFLLLNPSTNKVILCGLRVDLEEVLVLRKEIINIIF